MGEPFYLCVSIRRFASLSSSVIGCVAGGIGLRRSILDGSHAGSVRSQALPKCRSPLFKMRYFPPLLYSRGSDYYCEPKKISLKRLLGSWIGIRGRTMLFRVHSAAVFGIKAYPVAV